MRPPTALNPTRVAACVCAALTLSLLGPATVGAGAAQSLFGGTTTAATGAAKPATGVKVAPTVAKVKTTPAVKVKAAPGGKAVAPAVTPTTAPTTATTATTETSSKTSTSMIMALALGILLLGGIAFVIVRDAHSVAPVVEGAATGGTRNPEGRLRKRRAQAKAAKLQRKRHRKR